MNSIFNSKNLNLKNQPLFFGEPLNISRSDICKVPKLKENNEEQISFFWRPEAIDLQKDIRDWEEMPSNYKRIFEKNLAYQVLLDSIQERATVLALLPFSSLTEVENLIITWSFFENIHSRSYSYILQNVFKNPSDVFDQVLEDEKLKKRAVDSVKYYDDFIEYSSWYRLLGYGDFEVVKDNKKLKLSIDEYSLKLKFYLCLISIYILESVRFYVSFACSFSFAENNLMKGSAGILSLIARDEKLHTAFVLNIIKNIKKEKDPVMMEVMENSKEDIYNMFLDLAESEKDWIKYLMQEGGILGLNEKILNEYLEYIVNSRLRNLSLKPVYKSAVKDPLPWMAQHLMEANTHKFLQETESVSYSNNVDIKNFNIETFKNYLN